MQYICAGGHSDKLTWTIEWKQQSKLHQKSIYTYYNVDCMYQRIPSVFTSLNEQRPRVNTEQSNSDDIENDETCNIDK
ncbi:unnamed protein product [Schistosoma turkestanicum]|nr:unnamed protein product [Schistosoma turkestanicum]